MLELIKICSRSDLLQLTATFSVCRDGKWACPDKGCYVEASVQGDSHYTTFDKKRYDFIGLHKYYLMKTHNLSVEAQHFKCAMERSPVCILFMN